MGGSFKSGSGSLDFEQSDDSDDSEESTNETEAVAEPDSQLESIPEQESSDATETAIEESRQDTGSSSGESSSKYPYFVRRSSVGDERSNRMEVHVRDDVANHESEYLSALADELDTDSVAKTDAREFALKLAHEQPEEVARLMRDEGYGELN